MILETLIALFVAIAAFQDRTPLAAGSDPVLVIAGDVHADCNGRGDDRTASLVDRMPGDVVVLGDMAHRHGTKAEYRECYGPSWGRFLDRTLAVAGNHDWESGGEAFLRYFAANLGNTRHPTYYAIDRGAWRLYVLDSNCEVIDCRRQLLWLRRQLSAHPRACIAAFYHHATYTSTRMGDGSYHRTGRFIEALMAAGAELAITAHRHGYERFGRIGGVRQLVVATGGSNRWLSWAAQPAPGSQVRIGRRLGVVRLTLHPDSYAWRFVDASGQVRDSGSTRCSA